MEILELQKSSKLDLVVVPHIYIFAKIHLLIYIQQVNFVVCKLDFTKAKRKKNSVLPHEYWAFLIIGRNIEMSRTRELARLGNPHSCSQLGTNTLLAQQEEGLTHAPK